MAKTYASTFLYRKYSEYEKQIFSFIMNGVEIDRYTNGFDDIRYDVKKRQVSNSLVKLLDNKDVILISNEKPLSKAFKVFCAKDLKNQTTNNKKIYIDISNIITKSDESGKYVCRSNNIDIFISYLASAMHTLIYYVDENRITSNSNLTSIGANTFALLFTYVVDYVCKISSIPSIKNKCMYLSSLYFIGNILEKDYTTDGNRRIAQKISGLSERESSIVDIQLKPESMMDIKNFIDTLATILHLNKLTVDVVVERWMSVYGTGTVFALEIWTAFASMITDAYVGAYINNQKTIEKITSTNMVEFSKKLFQIGAESI